MRGNNFYQYDFVTKHYASVPFQGLSYSCSPLLENVSSIFHPPPLLHMAFSIPSNSQIFLTECTPLASSFFQIIVLSYNLLPGHFFLASLCLFIHLCKIFRERYMPINSINVKLIFIL